MSVEITNGNKKFSDALHLLNEAAKEKKNELKNILGNKYSHIREIIQNTASDRMDDLNHLKKQARQTAADLDKKVRKNPWPYISGAAIGTLFLGYVLGVSKRK